MHSSSLCKPHTAFYQNELLTKLMNISFFFMEPFNSPNRGNDILSGAKYLKSEAKQVKWRNIYEDIKAFVVTLYDGMCHITPFLYGPV